MNKVKSVIIGLAVSAGLIVSPAVAGANPNLNWTALANCESSGNPSIVSSNGMYHGLYQFDAQTWRSVGGTKYAPTANQATAAQQTEMAQILYSQRGSQPWPQCGRLLHSGGHPPRHRPTSQSQSR